MIDTVVPVGVRSGSVPVLLLAALLAGGCALPQRANQPAPQVYLLRDATAVQADTAGDTRGCLTLRIAPPRTAPGFDTARMAYVEDPDELRYFAWHAWADTPARMLAVLIEQRLDARRLFADVLSGTADVGTDLRLEVDHVRLLQSFRGDAVEILLSAKMRLVDLAERRLIAGQTLQIAVPAAAATPAAGVAAAQRATAQFLDGLEEFVSRARLPDCPP